MPWRNDPDARRQSAATYGDPEYLRNRAAARRRAGGSCEQCGHRHPRLQCDHKVNAAASGRPDHSLGNLQMLCAGDGSCKCHEKKTAGEGGGYRNRKKQDPQCAPRTNW
jgi:hypothetical protein